MIILDTSFLIAFYNKRDSRHEEALKIFDEITNDKLLAHPRPGRSRVHSSSFPPSIRVYISHMMGGRGSQRAQEESFIAKL
jgi:hypothetical protein